MGEEERQVYFAWYDSQKSELFDERWVLEIIFKMTSRP